MFNRIEKRILIAIMAVAITASIVPASGLNTVEAASKNHVLETNVKFTLGMASGDDSCLLVNNIVTKKNVEFGKKYSLKMKLYVPAQFLEKGELVVEPYLDFWGETDEKTYYGGGTALKSEYINKKSPVVKKHKDFYVVNLKQSINSFYDDNFDDISAPNGKGEIRASVRIVGNNFSYKGSIYFDDVKLIMDGENIASANYENKKVGVCNYKVNRELKIRKPKIVTFSEKTLEVTKKSISVKIATVTKSGVIKGITKGRICNHPSFTCS